MPLVLDHKHLQRVFLGGHSQYKKLRTWSQVSTKIGKGRTGTSKEQAEEAGKERTSREKWFHM
jgi:hypothetical protein